MPDPKDRNPERDPDDDAAGSSGRKDAPAERTFVHRILRYVPNLLRDEGVNIGVLLYDSGTGEYRLRLIEDTAEFNRVRRFHPRFDESVLRGLRDQLESRLGAAMPSSGNGGPIRGTLRNGQANPRPSTSGWLPILEKWDATLSQSLQLAEQKATTAGDIDTEINRLYDERVAFVPLSTAPFPSAGVRTRPQMRHYMDQIFRQAGLWGLIEKSVPVSQFTLDQDPMLVDYSYLRSDNKVRGFIQTISLTNKPEDVRIFAPLAKTIQERAPRPKPDLIPEFTAVTDIAFEQGNDEHRFFEKMLKNNGITPVPLDNFAVWAAKLRPMLQ